MYFSLDREVSGILVPGTSKRQDGMFFAVLFIIAISHTSAYESNYMKNRSKEELISSFELCHDVVSHLLKYNST